MTRFIIISLIGGILFAVLDGLINGNPLAQKLMECYKPIAKTSINIPVGIAIDIFYGFVMCGIFLLIYSSLPTDNPLIKGIIYGLIIWFFRVIMSVFTIYMTQQVPAKTLAYILVTGLVEVLILGMFYGLTIKPLK
ncbi:MAG: hypothetical protein JSV22_08395 [Bacteroidales bacterium]|nr:MAG: hypothetical protein JSV22_08395 [Bacteroidales bacterium]